MKRKSLLFLLLFALLAPWAAMAQQTETFTVYENETGTNSNIPIYGLWADANQQSEFIIPAADLADIACGTISKLTFHVSSKANKVWNGTAQIYLKEVSETSFATPYAYYGTEGATIVYEGGLDAYTSFEMAVPFTENVTYTYGGGNLLVGLIWTTGGNYGSASFYGKSATGASISHYSSYSPSAMNFIPRVTFTYTPSPLAPPATIAYTNNEPGNTTVSWTAPNTTETVTGYTYRYKKTAVTDWNGWYTLDASPTSVTLPGLDFSTEYEFEVKTLYGENESCSAKKVTFTTLSDCMTPENLTITNVTWNSATFNWTEGFGQGSWTFGYKKTTEEEYTTMAVAAADLPLTLDVFDVQTTYNVKVYPVCDETNFITDQFTTKCAPIDITAAPYNNTWSEDFTDYNSGIFSDNCWENKHIAGDGTYVFNIDGSWSGYTKVMRLPDMSIGTLTKLMLPGITLPNNNYQFVIDVYRSNSTYAPERNPYEGIRVFASANGEIEDATELAFIPRQYNEVNGNIPAETAVGWYTYELPIPMSGLCYIILRGESQYCTATYMDNFMVEPVPSCGRPSAMAYSNRTNHSVKISWNAHEGQTAWQIAYSKTSFDPNADGFDLTTVSTINVATNPYTFDKTLDADAYYMYVRSNCGTAEEPDYSKWSMTGVTVPSTTAVPKPTNFRASNPSPNSVELNWSVTGDFLEGCEIYYAEYGETVPDDPTDETEPLVIVSLAEMPTAEAPYVLGGLNSETRYYIWVRANQGTDGMSGWQILTTPSVGYITTLVACPTPTNLTSTNVTPHTATLNWTGYSDSYNVRYREPASEGALFSEGFEDATTFANWTTLDNGTGGNGSLLKRTTSNPHSGDYCFQFSSYNGSSTDDFDQYLISPELTVTGELKFYYRKYNYGTESFRVGYSTTTNDVLTEGVFTWTDEITDATTTWKPYTLQLPDNVKYIAINCTSVYQYYFYVDDITIGAYEIPAGEWNYANNPIEALTTDIEDLDDDTDYEWQVQATCAIDPNDWSASGNFHTLSVCTVPVADSAINITYNSADLYWTGYQEAYNVRYRTAEVYDILMNVGNYFTGSSNWTTQNQGSESGFYYLTDDYSLYGYWLEPDEEITGSQYLISPALDPVTSGTSILQFIAYVYNSTETIKVGFSSTDNSLSSFEFGEEISITVSDYRNIDVPAGTKYFAIEYVSGENYLALTNFIVVSNYVAAGAWQYADNVTSPTTINELEDDDTWYEWQVQGLGECTEGTEWSESDYFLTLKKTTTTQNIPLVEGWNWISSYIELDGEVGMNMLEQSLGENAEVIKSMTDMNEFDGEDWYGEMPLELEQMYMVYVSENCSAVLEGTPANPADHPINITEGWNWIGFPCDQEVSIADAFAGFTPEDGDAIKTFSGLAEYFDGEWFPDEELETLKPGQGYMYYSGSSTTLTFQTGAKTRRAISNLGELSKIDKKQIVEKKSLKRIKL